MSSYEYRVIPAPTKGEKAKGIKTPEGRIALAMETSLNALGADGWDYVRSDVVPLQERSGLTSKKITYHTVFVFRRPSRIDVPAEDLPGFGTFVQEDADAIAAEEEAQIAQQAALEAQSDEDAADAEDEAPKPLVAQRP